MKERKTVRRIIRVLLAIIILGGAVFWWESEMVNHKEKVVQVMPTPSANTTKPTDGTTGEPEPTMLPGMDEYVKINDDVIGTISIPDTNIDYPVLIGENNEYYLKHNIYGEEEKAGAIFADYKYGDTNIKEEFLRHTMIYGHHLRAKTMFTQITKYKEKEFFDSHPYVYYNNRVQQGKWKVFSVYVVNADNETIKRNFPDDKEYVEYLNTIKERSLYPVDVEISADKKVITLVTCSYETDNSRTVVHAMLEE